MRIEYSGAVIEEEEIRAVEAVLRKGIQPGENVRVFEERCARLLGKRHGVMVNSGSSALMIALRLLDLPRGSEQADVQAAALADARISRYVNGGAIRKAIYVKDKLLNLVVAGD